MATRMRAGRLLLKTAIDEFLKKRKKSPLATKTNKTSKGSKKAQPTKLEV
jgi:hypothetical protein